MIELEQIHRVFKVGDQEVHALADVGLAVARGEYLSIMGPSGSGKSTLLNIIGLLDRPSSGTYRLDGRDVTGLSDQEQARVRREKIGFVFQSFHLVPRLSAAENIELPMVLAGIPPVERKARSERLLRDFGLLDRARHRPEELSGGQRQRVAIARATGKEVLHLLEDLNQRDMTLIVVTHDPEIGQRAARQLHMVDGRIESDTRREASP